MKKLKTAAGLDRGKPGMNLGGHRLVLSGGAQTVRTNFGNRQHELRTRPQVPTINPAPPFPNVNTNIPNPPPAFPVVPSAPMQNNIPLPPNLPPPPSLPLNLPPPPAVPLPPVPPVGPMPQVPPPVQPSFSSVPPPIPPSFHSVMPPPPPIFSQSSNHMDNKTSSNRYSGFFGSSSATTDFPFLAPAPLKRSNSLDSLIDEYVSPHPSKRHRKSPSRYEKFESNKRSRRSIDTSRARSFEAEDFQNQKFEFIRLKPNERKNQKCETLSVTFQPDHFSTPKTGNDSDDEDNVELPPTPEWKLPESEPDSGLDSESDSEQDLETKDFPFRISKGSELYPQSRVPFIDTHCHLDYMYVKERHFTSFRSYIHKKDFPVNFSGCITCFCDPPAMRDRNYYEDVLSEDGVWGTFGLHPHNAAFFSDELLDIMKQANSHPKSLAWGEIGLDYTAKTTDEAKHVQQRAFVAQMQAAVAMGKPIVIHGRCAHEDTFSLLKQYVPTETRIHYHCFSASLPFAEKLIDFFPNMFIGITGLVTYNNSELEKIVQEFPFERILVETDSPFMRPSYHQCLDRNTPRVTTPGMGLVIAQKIADVKGLELDDVLIQVRENVSEMYGI